MIGHPGVVDLENKPKRMSPPKGWRRTVPEMSDAVAAVIRGEVDITGAYEPIRAGLAAEVWRVAPLGERSGNKIWRRAL